jgi:hypothetical protein
MPWKRMGAKRGYPREPRLTRSGERVPAEIGGIDEEGLSTPVARNGGRHRRADRGARRYREKKVNTIITNRAPSLSVSHAKSADSATTANTVGGRTVDAAVVSANAGGATVVRGTATGAGRLNAGIYFVSFPHNILNCTYVATNGDTHSGVGPPGEISVEQRSSTNTTDIEVRHYNSAGTETDYSSGDGFHIEVIC